MIWAKSSSLMQAILSPDNELLPTAYNPNLDAIINKEINCKIKNNTKLKFIQKFLFQRLEKRFIMK